MIRNTYADDCDTARLEEAAASLVQDDLVDLAAKAMTEMGIRGLEVTHFSANT